MDFTSISSLDDVDSQLSSVNSEYEITEKAKGNIGLCFRKRTI